MKPKILLSMFVGLLLAIPAWAETVAAPSSLIVPPTDPDGGYSVTWAPSATSGAQYVLEEATDPGFTESTVVYQGKATKAKLKGRPAGQSYHYRVKATLIGYEDSAWSFAGNGCDVPYLVSIKGNAGGLMTVNGEVTATVMIPVGDNRTVAVTPDEGFHIVSVLVDGILLVSDSNKVAPYAYAWPSEYTFNIPDELSDNPKNKHAIKVKFSTNTYTVNTSINGLGGTITPASPMTYKHNKVARYTIRPESGYRIAGVHINGAEQSGLPSSGQHVLSLPVTEDMEITAAFELVSPSADYIKYFPYSEGNAWNYRATTTTDGSLPPESYVNGVIIGGAKLVNGSVATIFTETNPENVGYAIENYRVIGPDRVIYMGNNDSDDIVTNEIVPYDEIALPLSPGSKLVQVDNKTIAYRDDLDGDGKDESARVYSELVVVGNEQVSGDLGSFNDCLKLRENVRITLKLSRNGKTFRGDVTRDSWFCADIGLVRQHDTISASDSSEESTHELIGYRVGTQAKGILPEFQVADAISYPNSDTESPGKPAIASDGTNFLVVTGQVSNTWTSNTIGVLLSPTGDRLSRFNITSLTDYEQKGGGSAVAFDGNNYLVVYGYDGKLLGQRVSREGQILDGPDGFVISADNVSSYPDVAFDGNNYLVVWGKFDMTYICENSLCYPKGHDIYAARVTPSGLVLDEFPVCTAAGPQTAPSLAFDGVNYLVAWIDQRDAPGPCCNDTDIFGSRITMDGHVLDPEGIPLSTATLAQYSPQLIFDGTDYFAVWQD